MSALTSAHITALQQLRNRFGPDSTGAKIAQLRECGRCDLKSARTVLAYHELLLFMAAHPESRTHARVVDDELRRIEAAAPTLAATGAGADALWGSGLAGVPVEADFSLALIEWLMATFPGRVEIPWEDGTAGTALSDLLALAVLAQERDGRLHEHFDMRTWLRFAAGDEATDHDDLAWVIDRIRAAVPDGELRDLVAEAVGLRVRWTPGPGDFTRTSVRFPERKLFLQRTAPKRKFDAGRLLASPLPDPVRLTPAQGRALIGVGRGVLAVREREADPVTYANPREVTLFSLDRGVDIALFGLEPRRRLPLESYFGYVAARNRVPVAYGGAWIMDRRAEIGVHLFDTFRGGESAWLFGQILRTYLQHYRVGRFQVDPYQFGADNPDAIRSGAFWFYYRFGFRPRDSDLRSLAEDEWRSIRRDRSYRTPAPVLRRFTGSPLVLDTPGSPIDAHRPDPTRLGVAVTRAIRERFGADRAAASRWAIKRVGGVLEVEPKRLGDDERFGFERLCPLLAVLPGLETFTPSQRRALARIACSKGGVRERDYALRIQRHAGLRAAFGALEATVDWDGMA